MLGTAPFIPLEHLRTLQVMLPGDAQIGKDVKDVEIVAARARAALVYRRRNCFACSGGLRGLSAL